MGRAVQGWVGVDVGGGGGLLLGRLVERGSKRLIERGMLVEGEMMLLERGMMLERGTMLEKGWSKEEGWSRTDVPWHRSDFRERVV